MIRNRIPSLAVSALLLAGCSENERVHGDDGADKPAELLHSHYDDGAPMWVGTIDRDDLEEPPFDAWFEPGYQAYVPDSDAVQALASSIADADVEVYLGTWCSDSTRDVPRLTRILDEAGFPPERLEMVALSDHPGEFKTSPSGKERRRRIHRTPTIIVSKNGEELGRIVQNARESLEEDLLAIVRGKPYEPRFRAESRLHELFTTEPVAALEARTAEIVEELRGLDDADSLWHYAQYDLLLNDKPREALTALDIFLRLYPESAKGHLLRAKAHAALGNDEAALVSVREALRYDADNEEARALEKKLTAP